MHFLLLCILSSTAIFLIFKILHRLHIPAFPVIVINYLAATLLGFLIYRGDTTLSSIGRAPWLPLSMIIGIMFILMFFLVAFSTRKAGLSVTTVASKMSVIFPIAFSIIIDTGDRLGPLKAMAIATALGGVLLTVHKTNGEQADKGTIFIPLLLFVGMGLVDSLVKLAQQAYVDDRETAIFSAILFLNAFVSGLLVAIFYRKYRTYFLKTGIWSWGLLLGGVNFGSIYFLVRALNHITPSGRNLEGSVIFGANNISIVALSVLIGWLIFREKLRPVNWVGIALSVLALLLFAMV